MARTIVVGLTLLLCACAARSKNAAASEPIADRAQAGDAGVKRDDKHPLFVGRGPDGEVVMAATHHDSMNGLAVARDEMAVTGNDAAGDLVCKRETLTGTHLPQWICRFLSEVEQDRLSTQRMLDNLPKSCMDKKCFGD